MYTMQSKLKVLTNSIISNESNQKEYFDIVEGLKNNIQAVQIDSLYFQQGGSPNLKSPSKNVFTQDIRNKNPSDKFESTFQMESSVITHSNYQERSIRLPIQLLQNSQPLIQEQVQENKVWLMHDTQIQLGKLIEGSITPDTNRDLKKERVNALHQGDIRFKSSSVINMGTQQPIASNQKNLTPTEVYSRRNTLSNQKNKTTTSQNKQNVSYSFRYKFKQRCQIQNEIYPEYGSKGIVKIMSVGENSPNTPQTSKPLNFSNHHMIRKISSFGSSVATVDSPSLVNSPYRKVRKLTFHSTASPALRESTKSLQIQYLRNFKPFKKEK